MKEEATAIEAAKVRDALFNYHIMVLMNQRQIMDELGAISVR